MRIQWSAVPQSMPSSTRAIFADTPALPFSTRDSVPRWQLKRAAVSPTVQPTSSMLSRISSPKCGGFSMERTHSSSVLVMSFMLASSVIVDQIDIHDLGVLEAEHHSPVAGHVDGPPACPVRLQRMEQEARSGGAKDSDGYKVVNCTRAQPVFHRFGRLARGKVIAVTVLTWTGSLLQPEQNASDPGRRGRRQTCMIIPFVQRPQALVPDLQWPTVARIAPHAATSRVWIRDHE